MKRKAKIFEFNSLTSDNIEFIADALESGSVAVLPTDSVYGLVVCSSAKNALNKLNQIKNNPSGKLPQVLCDKETAYALVCANANFDKIAKLWPSALTVIAKTSSQGAKLLGGSNTIGLRVPDDDLILSLIKKIGRPFFASSANKHGEPVCSDRTAISNVFKNTADIIVLKDSIGTKSSAIIDISAFTPVVIRGGFLAEKALNLLR
ncbi:MAG: Sua5/YciO/YrdC/YwlC family protein [Elusimicrobiota bacterium]|jgi:L-threonylcarbamoyladenylate synthase|nr:Sua5/YciO/YrdC/YwlC family protein [Elusimicrobiota bacterium]